MMLIWFSLKFYEFSSVHVQLLHVKAPQTSLRTSVILFRRFTRFSAWRVKQLALLSWLNILIIRKSVVHRDALAHQITTYTQYVHTHIELFRKQSIKHQSHLVKV